MSMTENKIKPTMEQTIYCLKAESEKYPEVCEECQLYEEVGCDHCYDDTNDMAIKFLKELERYKAIGTIEEFKALKEDKKFLEFLYNHILPNEMEQYLSMYYTKDKVAVNGYADQCGLTPAI